MAGSFGLAAVSTGAGRGVGVAGGGERSLEAGAERLADARGDEDVAAAAGGDGRDFGPAGRAQLVGIAHQAVGDPAALNIVETAMDAGNFETLIAALQATGLDSTLAVALSEAEETEILCGTDFLGQASESQIQRQAPN